MLALILATAVVVADPDGTVPQAVRDEFVDEVVEAFRDPDMAGQIAGLRPGCTVYTSAPPVIEPMADSDFAYLSENFSIPSASVSPTKPAVMAHVAVTGCATPLQFNLAGFHDGANGRIILMKGVAGHTLAGMKLQIDALVAVSEAAEAGSPAGKPAGKPDCQKAVTIEDTSVLSAPADIASGWHEDWQVNRCGVVSHAEVSFTPDADGQFGVKVRALPGQVTP